MRRCAMALDAVLAVKNIVDDSGGRAGPQDFALMCAKGPARNNRLMSAPSQPVIKSA
jgi:hypothetical protein